MCKRYKFILMLILLALPSFSAYSAGGKKIILQFNTMFGVDTPFLSTDPVDNPAAPLPSDPTIRGVFGDYESWKIKTANGKLFSDGTLIINIKGLIFGSGEANDEDHFRALVSCQLTGDIADPATPATFSNIITDPFPVKKPIGKGNANIKTKVKLPGGHCVAPVIMILNGGGEPGEPDVWFAITGN